MTNETEYQRGYREGAEKMREEIKDVILLIAKNTKPHNKEVAEYFNILARNIPSIPLPITPQPEAKAEDDEREMRDAFEAWAANEGYEEHRFLEIYERRSLEALYEGWQAAWKEKSK